jgi:predicted DNA-binding WGR domain protein
MARYYGLTLQPTLFGEMSLVRHWGRIGTRGRQKTESFASAGEAISALSKLATQKIRRGYASDGFGIVADATPAAIESVTDKIAIFKHRRPIARRIDLR